MAVNGWKNKEMLGKKNELLRSFGRRRALKKYSVLFPVHRNNFFRQVFKPEEMTPEGIYQIGYVCTQGL